ncbi:hypothetical protein H5410_004346 [Solanum commersonii]|uniref:Uncharacterized protein n=1 Tax=Solanum commersonii TaxID=4109 RepID=A0A9J6B751_SOLCO|nr:hypothetical protein H5410_004346 [Solanum commersonii]
MATRNQTRPSCARVKVEVDLMKKFPKRIKIGMRQQSGEVMEKWIKIKYEEIKKNNKGKKGEASNRNAGLHRDKNEEVIVTRKIKHQGRKVLEGISAPHNIEGHNIERGENQNDNTA